MALRRTTLNPLLLVALTAATACDRAPRAECRGCSISIVHVARIGESSGPGEVLSRTNRLSRLEDGRFILLDQAELGVMKLYDGEGNFLRRVGRHGGGPAEYNMPWFHTLDASGDTLIIVDPPAGRITLLSPSGEKLLGIRDFEVSTTPYLRFFPDGRMMANGLHLSAIGSPLHLVDRDGRWVRGLGTEEPGEFSSADNRFFRAMAISGDSAVWAVPRTRYRLELWDTAGRLLKRLERDVDWMEPGASFVPRTPLQDPPSSMISGVWESQTDTLWVVSEVAAPDWQDRMEAYETPTGTERYRFARPGWTMRVEVLNVATHGVIAAHDFDVDFVEMLGDGYFYTRTLDESGVPFIDVWHLQLEA